jgi:glycosyl-4,4'-diaponeurosporenoate acyltransferase
MKWLGVQLVKLNLLFFLLISVVISLIAEKLPNSLYNYKFWLFKEKSWEKGGRFYEKWFVVKSWKCRLPEISDFLKSRFTKKHLNNNNKEYLKVFLMESCKSEFTHWMIIVSSLFFYINEDLPSVISIFFLSCILNVPYIIIQRYNRPRIIKLLDKTYQHEMVLAHAN